MQTLMILRHAKAVPWGSTTDDFSRPLNDIGIAHAGAVADWLKANLQLPQIVLCSPSQRTRETLAPIAAAAAELELRVHYLPQLYGASLRTLVKVLDHAFGEADSAMVVGHNPGLEDLMFETLSDKESRGISRLATGTLVVIRLDPDWAEAQGGGRVEHMVRGKKLLA